MFNLFFRRYVPGFRVGPNGVPGKALRISWPFQSRHIKD